MPDDREIYVRNALGAWWAGSGVWVPAAGPVPPVRALRFSSVAAARFDIGWVHGAVQFVEQQKGGAWKVVHSDAAMEEAKP